MKPTYFWLPVVIAEWELWRREKGVLELFQSTVNKTKTSHLTLKITAINRLLITKEREE
jgi:hypothetical protein